MSVLDKLKKVAKKDKQRILLPEGAEDRTVQAAVYCRDQGFADVNMGRGAIVIGLAAVIIGEVLCRALFKKGASFWVRMLFVIVGGILYYYAIGLVLWLQMPTDNMKLFTAAIVAPMA